MAARAIRSSSSSSSGENDVMGTAKQISPRAEDTCSCNVDAARGTSTPRTCYECLNVRLQSGEQCWLGAYGGCLTTSEMIAQRTKLTGVSTGAAPVAQNDIYSSENSTYCEAEDVVCSACLATWSNETLLRNPSLPRSCVGSGGCVCVDWCARERGIVTTESSCSAVLSATRTTTDTPSAVATADEALSSESHGTINVTWFVHSMVFIGALLLLILLIECATGKTIIQPLFTREEMARWCRNLCRRKKPKQPKLGPLMALSGWREHREQLIQEERTSKEDGAEVSLHGFNSAGSLPPIASVEAPPMHAIVELGDGYRPLSPSANNAMREYHDAN